MSETLAEIQSAIAMQTGFVLKSFIDLTNWKSAPIFRLPIETVDICPTDGEPLEVIAELASQTTDERIRLGCCPSCGLVTYLDRPTKRAVADYYRHTWMGETRQEVTRQANEERARQGETKFTSTRERPALDIGCGYGANIGFVREMGYRRIVGVEACAARAHAVRCAFGIEVYQGAFEDIHIPGTFELIQCHQVLEHTHDPLAFVKRCAALQVEGDRLLICTPDFEQEPAMNTLMFWPHLHSFSRASMARLIESCGYEVCDPPWELRGNLISTAIRKNDPATYACEVISPQAAIDKLLRGLGLKPISGLMTWQRDCDGATLQTAPHVACCQDGGFPRRAEIEPISQHLSEAPLEIQFTGRVEMCFK